MTHLARGGNLHLYKWCCGIVAVRMIHWLLKIVCSWFQVDNPCMGECTVHTLTILLCPDWPIAVSLKLSYNWFPWNWCSVATNHIAENCDLCIASQQLDYHNSFLQNLNKFLVWGTNSNVLSFEIIFKMWSKVYCSTTGKVCLKFELNLSELDDLIVKICRKCGRRKC